MVKLNHKQGLVSLRSKRPTPNPCRVLAQVLKRPMRHKRIFPKGRLRLRQYSVRVCRWMTCSSPSVFHKLENRRGRVSLSEHSAPRVHNRCSLCRKARLFGARSGAMPTQANSYPCPMPSLTSAQRLLRRSNEKPANADFVPNPRCLFRGAGVWRFLR